MIADLNKKRLQYEDSLNELRKQQSEIEEKDKLLKQMLSEAKSRQKEILANAYKESSDIISDIKRQMYTLLDELKKKGKSKGRETVKQVEAKQEFVTEKLNEYDVDDKGTPAIDEIKNGDVIFVRSLGYDAPVIEVNRKNNRLKVMAGNMEFEVPLSDIGFKRGKSVPLEKGIIQTEKIEETVSTKINLVGLRVDEALSGLEHFLNHAALAELREATIIHGIGKGLLMKAIHEHLKDHPLVKHYRSGTQAEGGNGVTVVKLA